MWSKEFELEIMGTLKKIPIETVNDCFQARVNGQLVFIKKVLPRNQESISDAITRIEASERIGHYYHSKGLNTITAFNYNNSCVHQIGSTIWVAYPWVHSESRIEINKKTCSQIGRTVGQMHNLAPLFNNQELATQVGALDKSYPSRISSLDKLCDILTQAEINEMLYLADYGEKCAIKLAQKKEHIVSHRDLHFGNVLILNNEFTVIDWELAGPIHPKSEIFDVALSCCGFSDGNPDISLFSHVLRGYSETSLVHTSEVTPDVIVGQMYLPIINHFLLEFYHFCFSKNRKCYERALKFLQQYRLLCRYFSVFSGEFDRVVNASS